MLNASAPVLDPAAATRPARDLFSEDEDEKFGGAVVPAEKPRPQHTSKPLDLNIAEADWIIMSGKAKVAAGAILAGVSAVGHIVRYR